MNTILVKTETCLIPRAEFAANLEGEHLGDWTEWRHDQATTERLAAGDYATLEAIRGKSGVPSIEYLVRTAELVCGLADWTPGKPWKADIDGGEGGDTIITAETEDEAMEQALAWAAAGSWEPGNEYYVRLLDADGDEIRREYVTA